MSDVAHDLVETETHDTWPAFVDLFAATSLLFITLIGVFVYVAVVKQSELETTRRQIARRLAEVSQQGQLFGVDSTDPQFVRIVLRERATFPQGRFQWTTLRDSGKTALKEIGEALKDEELRGLYREIRVLGHTDRVPFDNVGFTNWELSAARAAVVARYLVNWVQVDPCRVSATGRGPYFPVDTNDLEANRRIEIQIVPRPKRDAEAADGCMSKGDGTRAYAAEVIRKGAAPTFVVPSSGESRSAASKAAPVISQAAPETPQDSTAPRP